MFSCLTFFSQANFHVTCRFFFLKVKQWAKGNWFCSLFLRWDPCLYGRHMHERLSFSFPSQSPFSTLCCSLGFLWPIPTNTRDPIFWGKLNQPNIQLAPHFSNRSKLSKILHYFVLKKRSAMWQRVNLNWNLRWCAQFPCRQNCHHSAFEKYWNCWWLLSVSRKTNMNSQFGIILGRCSNLFMMCTRSRQLCQQDYQSSYRCAHFRKMYAEEGGGGCNQQLCAITFFLLRLLSLC